MATLTLADVRPGVQTPRFNLRKATEAGIAIAQMTAGRIGLKRLMSLLYLADRRLINESGRGLTDDDYIAIRGLGAVPRHLTAHAVDRRIPKTEWHLHFELRGDYLVLMNGSVQRTLSDFEEEMVKAVMGDYGGLEWGDFLSHLRREAPEGRVAKEPREFTLRDILLQLGESPEDAEAAYAAFDSWRNIKYTA